MLQVFHKLRIALYLSLICISAIVSPGYAQPSWVKEIVRRAENLTAPNDASAIVLHDVADLEISRQGNATTRYQIACKILTSDGEQFGVLSLPTAPFLKVKHLKGWVIQDDRSSTSLSREHIVTVGIQESVGYYDDDQTIVAALPNVKPGVIVAFEWTTEETGWTSLYQSFTFQVQQPVQFARFSVTLPKNWELIKAGRRDSEIEFTQQENRYTWLAQDLPYQPEEPLAPSWYYLSRRISITCFEPSKYSGNHFSDWRSVAKWVSTLHQQPATPNSEIIDKANKVVEGLTTVEEKLRAISAFSQQDIRYVAVEIGKGRWQPRPAGKTLLNRYGDCKDKTTLMRAMLQAIDIPSVPVLANLTYPVEAKLPTPFQFNHCIIAIPFEKEAAPPELQNAIVEDWLFFDPTDPTIVLGELPWMLQGANVLMGTERDTVFRRLPSPSVQYTRRVYRAAARLDETGAITANVTVSDFGSLASRTRYDHHTRTGSAQVDEWQNIFAGIIPGAKLRGFQTRDNGDSVQTSFTIEAERYLQKVADLILLRLDIFNPAEPPQLTAGERQHPVWFGAPLKIDSHISWELPEGWRAEVDTAAVKSACDGAAIYSKMSFSGTMLDYKTRERRYGKLIWPAKYQEAYRFSKDMSFVRGQTVLLHRQ